MQELFANELSITIDSLTDFENISVLKNVYNELKKFGIKTCRISSDEINAIYGILGSDSRYRNFRDFMFAFFIAPYEGNSLVNENSELYISHDWKYMGSNCFGLTMAYITNSIALSIDRRKWKEEVTIFRDDTPVDVRNISDVSHIEFHKKWFEDLNPIELVRTFVSPYEKSIRIRDDHGKDVLMKFGKRMLRSQYVEKIVNSLPFNSEGKQFIRNIFPNGLVECVLYWCDEGFGLVVKTTGRNYRETAAIAEILDKEYGRR